MLINEVSKNTGLTKKAIEYYTIKGLVTPTVLDNGYREYCDYDIDLLNKICILRKLDISTDEIKLILDDDTSTTLYDISVKKELDLQRDTMKKAIFEKLSSGIPYSEISKELEGIYKSKTITEKILDAFPGYYGRFICLHFSRFLNEPIQTEIQQSAFKVIISFLDNVLPFDFSEEIEDYLLESTKYIGTRQITEMIESYQELVENPDDFFSNDSEILKQYLRYNQSDDYKSSYACKITKLLKGINSENGYYDEFIPAMKKLSRSYAEYYEYLEIANEKLIKKYPQIKELADEIYTLP